jgi:hypothetical protein
MRQTIIRKPSDAWIQSSDYKTGKTFRRRSDYLGISFDGFKPVKYGYGVRVATSDNYPLVSRSFKSKKKAIQFVEEYMRQNQ